MSGNDEQIEFWNSRAGETWVEAQEQMDLMLAPLSALALDAAAPQPGERAIDVGCGCGDTSLAIANRGAAVWGVDISAPMLARAKTRAEGMKDVAFTETDAATQSYTPDHDLVFSRFGVMFFADPVAAFANIKTGLTPSGRLVFVCWQAAAANAWLSIAGRAVQPFLPEADPEADPVNPRAPGPFAFADATYLETILASAGYANIDIASVTPTLHVGDDMDDAMRFQSRIGPLSRVLAELDDAQRKAALDAARAALAEHETAAGIDLISAAWVVSARPA